jgi:hypothetical protein
MPDAAVLPLRKPFGCSVSGAPAFEPMTLLKKPALDCLTPIQRFKQAISVCDNGKNRKTRHF